MPVELNALESARFGLIAGRVRDAHASPAAINAAARELNVQFLTARIECADHSRIHAAEADGFRMMDTIVYYERSLSDRLPELSQASDIAIRQACHEDAPAVANIAQAAFANYLGHFHADPRLDRRGADATYVDWAQRSVTRQSNDEQARVALCAGSLAGFLTLRRNSCSEFEIVLNAVHPDLQRRGLYQQLLQDALLTGREAGAERMIVSTQLNNFPVQRAWTKLGFRLFSAFHTFHKWYF